jgi:hypothetical protein
VLHALASIPHEAIAALLTLATTGVGWLIVRILTSMKGDEDRSADMHKQGWAQVADRDREIVLLRGIVMQSFTREGAYKNAFECVLLILKLPVSQQAEELRKVRHTLERSISGRGAGGA